MAIKFRHILVLAGLSMFLGQGCGDLGKVDQGRVVEFDSAKGVVTFIRDLKADVGKPDYSHLPPVSYAIPKDQSEMGHEPRAGQRMKLDTKAREIVIFDKANQGFKKVNYTLIYQK